MYCSRCKYCGLAIYRVIPEDVKHLIEDRSLHYRFFVELALKYLAE